MFFIFCLLRQGNDKIESEKGSSEVLIYCFTTIQKEPRKILLICPEVGCFWFFFKIPINSVNEKDVFLEVF